ncbi:MULTISPECIES: LLM class flavin-dependent oxidoreductase [Streptosporangium]|uniref:LLM class flavin-dependent oxidoreductase n=1 Tax=Streptosporangium jomthongense TaxID=1193683 RepID=A0ABV8EUC4_9ACTN
MTTFLITLPTRDNGGRGARADLPGFVTDPRAPFGPFDHLLQAGRAAELAAFDGALLPFDPRGEESLVAAGSLLRQSRWLRVAAGFHPGVATPVYAAKVSASLQRFSGDRLDWRVVVDLDPEVARAQGDFLEGADRYARAEEFLTVAKGVWTQEGYGYEGRFYQVLAGGFLSPLAGRAFPRVHLSGTSPQALELSARHADVHVFDPGDDFEASGLQGVTYGLRLPVLARDDDAEAWRAARRLWLRGGGTEDTLPEPDPETRLWNGFPGPGLVGSYESVAAGIRDYADRGIGAFVLEATPYVEETYRLGERLLPLLVKENSHVR